MEPLLLLPLVIGFFVTFLVLPKWIVKAKKIGLIWEDMNKYGHPKNVAGSGGLIVVMGFILAILVYVSLKTFYFNSTENLIEIFAMTSSVLILANVGLVDDLLGWWHGGLSKRFRLLMCLFAAIPLIVINAGSSSSFLVIGSFNWGWIYPLIIIPLGILGASTTFNFLAGYNGLESSQGILVLAALSFVAYFSGITWVGLIGMCFVFSLLAFWIFNKYPAQVLPGDVLTYPIGGLIAIIAIFANLEKIAIFFFIPYILEVILKSRGRLTKQSFGKPNKDNSLEMPYDKIYGLEHLAIFFVSKLKKKVYESDVVWAINIFQVAIIIIGAIIFRNSIF